jgi:hypothetical protein
MKQVACAKSLDDNRTKQRERKNIPAYCRRTSVDSRLAPFDGRISAVWAQTRQGNRLNVNVATFEPLSRRIVAGIHEEAHDLGRFLTAPNVDIEIG